MCWWFDKIAVKQTLKLRDKFNISTYIETGTFRGINIKFHSYNFSEVLGCEINNGYYRTAKGRVRNLKNVTIYRQTSPEFLADFRKKYRKAKRRDIVLIYLDAHFYNPLATSKDRWVILKELKVLKGFKNCIICIHDFDCAGLGHLCYNGQSLDYSLIKKDILDVNPDFFFYTNSRRFREVHSKQTIRRVIGLASDEDTLETIKYHNCDSLKYRGILYCIPERLDLKEFKLVKLRGGKNGKRS